jgi:hypothetical protein
MRDKMRMSLVTEVWYFLYIYTTNWLKSAHCVLGGEREDYYSRERVRLQHFSCSHVLHRGQLKSRRKNRFPQDFWLHTEKLSKWRVEISSISSCAPRSETDGARAGSAWRAIAIALNEKTFRLMCHRTAQNVPREGTKCAITRHKKT